MALTSNGSPILAKTRELCQVIIEQPEFADIRRRIDTFQQDNQVLAQFRYLSEKREALEKKQEEGATITQAEIAEFERLRDGFVSHPVASAFLKAQEDLHEIRRVINAFVTNTFETGKLAAIEDIVNASCGHQCGCHDH
jgi:cell fate (sporulation/competence/biofilm development) regulator YlbF (YheA/YmcA/DUF963 family)